MTQSSKVQHDHNQYYWRLDTWGLLALGVVGLDFCWGCILERGSWLCVYFIWNVGLLSVFRETWFVVCIACKCVIELWLVLWRDQYIYLLYQMEKKRKKKALQYLLKARSFMLWTLLYLCPCLAMRYYERCPKKREICGCFEGNLSFG